MFEPFPQQGIPMSTSQILDLALWCAHPVLQAAVLVAIWRSKLHKQFPVFFTYLICQIAIFAAIFPFRNHYAWFFWIYWIGATINAVLGFKIIHEVFLDVFRRYHTLKDLGTVVFKWAGVVMLLVSVVVAFSNSNDHDPLIHAVTTLQRSVRMVQFGLVLFLLLFARFLGVSRRQFSFGVALGFGLFGGVELILLVLGGGGFLHKAAINVANMAVYDFAIVIWMVYALTHSELRQPTSNPLQTQRWERGLAEAQHPVAADSLIPMFESMVERAISRSSSSEEPCPSDLKFPATKAFSAASGGGSKARG
jgi:hypothetical protein